MRGSHIAAIVAVVGMFTPLQVGAGAPGPPTVADIDALEQTVQLPTRAHRLGDYARYYTLETVKGRDFIKGFYLLDGPDPAGRYFRRSPVHVDDGGCSVVTIYWDLQPHRVTSAVCNGVG